MKKLLALFTLTFTFTFSYSQSYQILDGGDISNGSRTYWCDTANATFTTEYWLKNTSANAVTGKSHKRIYQLNNAAAQCWWCVGIDCYPATFTVGGDFTLAPGAGSWLTIDFNPHGFTGVTMVRYIITNNANAADSTYIDITYNMPGGPASVNVHPADNSSVNVFPNPANADFDVKYDLGNTTSSVVFSIYNSLGEVVKEIQLTENSGVLHLDAAEFPMGTYIGTLSANGVIISRQQIAITK